MRIDEAKLIEEVKKRRPLWDPRLKSYQSRELKWKLWNEVAESLDISSKWTVSLCLRCSNFGRAAAPVTVLGRIVMFEWRCNVHRMSASERKVHLAGRPHTTSSAP